MSEAHGLRVRPRQIVAVSAALLAYTVFWMRGIAQLYTRHPHEDAFILFRYAEHFAAGLGIVFNPEGPPAEGATDFLWLVLLSGLVRIGFDVAIAALFLNALGCALLAYVFCQLLTRHCTSWPECASALGLALVLPWLASAQASYDGFSTQLYCALVVLTYQVYLDDEATSVYLPYLGLTLGLFRPDGVILGGAFGVLALVRMLRSASQRARFLRHAGVAVLLGGLYFVLRYRYFGALLPLPLYVKSHGGEQYLGVEANREWFWHGGGPLYLLCVSAAALVGLAVLSRFRGVELRRVLLLGSGGLPALVLIVALNRAHQSQNVDFRFQAPAYVLALAVALALVAELSRHFARPLVRMLCLLACLAALVPSVRTGKHVWGVDYLDSFAVRFGKLFPRGRLALTEAGRMAYWTSASVYDAVGLNTRETALRPATPASVGRAAPDVIMYNAAGTLDTKRYKVLAGSFARDSAIQIDPRSLQRALLPWTAPYARDLASYEQADVPTLKLGSLALTRYLATAQGYDVFAVRNGRSFGHLYGVRTGQPYSEAIARELLGISPGSPYVSYARAKDLRRSVWACRFMAFVAKRYGPSSIGLPEVPTCSRKGPRSKP